jgi:hypothetical protein
MTSIWSLQARYLDLQARLIQTLFTSVYSSMPWKPISRPMPLSLKPPNGEAGSVGP